MRGCVRAYAAAAMRRVPLLVPILLLACDNDRQLTAQDRVLDGFSYVDAGAVAVGDRSVFTVPLFSKAGGKVEIFEILAEDISAPEGAAAPAFLVDDSSWAVDCDSDDDGAADCLDLLGYDPDSEDDTLPLPVVFAPTVKGYYEGILTIWSNDNTSEEKAPLPGEEDLPEEEQTIWTVWRVQLRGLSDYACGRVFPEMVDFGDRTSAIDGDFSDSVEIVNCGIVPLTVSSIQVDFAGMSSRTLPPLYVLPGQTEEVVIGWTVASAEPVSAHVTFTGNSESLAAAAVEFVGNDCDRSLDAVDWDADLDGWTVCGGDCDDLDAYTSPAANEAPDDLEDNDCDGEIDELDDDTVGNDDDADGCSESGGDCGGDQDCNDADPNVGPYMTEVYNQIDDDCDGQIDESTEGHDDDGDGWTELHGDCDDAETLVGLEAEEVVDGRDNDCDGIVDEGGPAYDDDADTFKDVESDPLLNDCDDQDPWVFVAAREYCDGYDNDCDGLVDDGEADEADGACTFRPTRRTSAAEGDSGVADTTAGGCSTGLGVSLSGTALALALVRRRRRD
ncbi:hypothetical protein LBMAG42_15850 [Deltaproteobacteria bacterium]|nr:hypothetical protein LBMAG42_15850 [Deltaproteobacteria bacterium]